MHPLIDEMTANHSPFYCIKNRVLYKRTYILEETKLTTSNNIDKLTINSRMVLQLKELQFDTSFYKELMDW